MLDMVKQQQGDDAELQGFRRALDSLRVNKAAMSDWNFRKLPCSFGFMSSLSDRM